LVYPKILEVPAALRCILYMRATRVPPNGPLLGRIHGDALTLSRAEGHTRAAMPIDTAPLLSDDPRYPQRLSELTPAPTLWVRGGIVDDDALAIAIVGSRRATAYGLEVAAVLARDLAARGVTIVSGFARGIDSAAHRAALEAGGRTIAVLGCGIDVAYPPENRRLADEVATRGALVTQFPPGPAPLPYPCPAATRRLAALVLGVVVVEAAERSGSLSTAGFAADLGREVYAVPGKITSPTSAGVHKLLRDGARLVETWTDIVQELPNVWRRRVHDTVVATIEATQP